mmetsp:Transcript_29518/g.45023  ORF Transcript_29518/g.45023 Transcript_29518/m.45023 type:complete len:238 (+) Transcript_29518:120-833(+)|eukprot:CAMPEP_0194241504 /NCGR_PEP_ID=MMETSP0158-20130606/7350_1 /TAXON_ID=33649 /ORGANISM="Thalassionema nitzschioides, Strain L26-B" /LENGTH=237 /DNA_ID=CAMNT_0038976413 /DNA_START=44 /DNA_END=757 /DNA_ORIENTATION=+
MADMDIFSYQGSLAELVIPGKSKRTDFPLVPRRCAILVIDIQEYLSKPMNEDEEQSYFFQESLPGAVTNISKLVSKFRSIRDSQTQGCEVIFTYLEALTEECRDVSLDYKLSGPVLATLPNIASSPAKFLPEVSPNVDGRGDIRIPKTSCSVFASTNLRYVLQNLKVEQLVVTGQLTNQCVESAVRDAADLGLFVTLVKDACAAKSANDQGKGLEGMKGFCRILETNDVIQELSASV